MNDPSGTGVQAMGERIMDTAAFAVMLEPSASEAKA